MNGGNAGYMGQNPGDGMFSNRGPQGGNGNGNLGGNPFAGNGGDPMRGPEVDQPPPKANF